MNTHAFLQETPQQVRLALVARIRLRRKEKGLSQKQLAARSGVSFGSIKRFERTGEIALNSLIKIAFVLGYEGDFEQLFARQYFNSIQDIIDAQH